MSWIYKFVKLFLDFLRDIAQNTILMIILALFIGAAIFGQEQLAQLFGILGNLLEKVPGIGG